jgi:hypothetical protein
MTQQKQLQAPDIYKAVRERLARQQEEIWQTQLQEILACIDAESCKATCNGHVSVKMPVGPGTNLIARELLNTGFKMKVLENADNPTKWLISWVD